MHPGPTFPRLRELKFSVKVVRHIWKIKFVENFWAIEGSSPGVRGGKLRAGILTHKKQSLDSRGGYRYTRRSKPGQPGRVQFHDILYTLFRDMLYTPARA